MAMPSPTPVNAADPSLQVEPRNTKGSAENIPLLEAGTHRYRPRSGRSGLRSVRRHRPRAGQSEDRQPRCIRRPACSWSAPTAPIARIKDLVGKPVAFGARGSGLVILARYVLDGLGLDQDKDFQAIYLDRAGDGPAMVLDGRAAALWGGGSGWPGFTTMAQAPGGARFIAPSADEIAQIRAKHSFLKALTIPAGSYPTQDQPIASVGSWSFVLARPTLDDDVAYRLARALHRGESDLGQKLPQARETTAANTAAAAPNRPELIHPGVAKYLREIGASALSISARDTAASPPDVRHAGPRS